MIAQAVRSQFIGIYYRSCLTCNEMKSRPFAQEFVERRTRIFLRSPILSMTPFVTYIGYSGGFRVYSSMFKKNYERF